MANIIQSKPGAWATFKRCEWSPKHNHWRIQLIRKNTYELERNWPSWLLTTLMNLGKRLHIIWKDNNNNNNKCLFFSSYMSNSQSKRLEPCNFVKDNLVDNARGYLHWTVSVINKIKFYTGLSIVLPCIWDVYGNCGSRNQLPISSNSDVILTSQLNRTNNALIP